MPSRKGVKKVVEVAVQIADFINIDLYLAGVYQLRCRVYTQTHHQQPSSQSQCERVDAISQVLPIGEPEYGIAHDAAKNTGSTTSYSGCGKHGRSCTSWRCRKLRSSRTGSDAVWISPNLDIRYEAQSVTVQAGAVFRFEADVTASEIIDPVCTQSATEWDAYLEAELWHCQQETDVGSGEYTFQQRQRFRLNDLLAGKLTSRTCYLHEFLEVSFDSPCYCSFEASPSEKPDTAFQVLWKHLSQMTAFFKRPRSSETNRLADLFHGGSTQDVAITPSNVVASNLSPPFSLQDYYLAFIMRNVDVLLNLCSDIAKLPAPSGQPLVPPWSALTQFLPVGAKSSGTDDSDADVEDITPNNDKIKAAYHDFLKNWCQSTKELEELRKMTWRLVEKLSTATLDIWKTFLMRAAIIPLEKAIVKRVQWAKSKSAKFDQHFILSDELVHDHKYCREVARTALQFRARNQPFVTTDIPQPIPVIMNHFYHACGDFSEALDSPLAAVMSPESYSLPSTPLSCPSEYFAPRLHAHTGDASSMVAVKGPKSIISERSCFGASPDFAEVDAIIQSAMQSPNPIRGCHVVVFVHGLLGSAYDFRQYRNKVVQARYNLNMSANDIVFLNSNSNEDDTFEDIEVLANNLAKEVLDFVRERDLQVERMSFVCHSLGGLIARCAIEKHEMQQFRPYFHTFTTFGTPHLSGARSSNFFLRAFASLYQCIERSKCLDQLHLRDSRDPRQCLLYKLATNSQALESFQKVRLIASVQDGYAGLHSALAMAPSPNAKRTRWFRNRQWSAISLPTRLGTPQFVDQRPSTAPAVMDGSAHPPPELLARQATDESADDSKNAAYNEMVMGLSTSLARANVERYVVWFPGVADKPDILGRTAHIAMLEDPMFLEMAVIVNRLHL
ncbi:hypothetical protein HDU85_004764 [Gaertneriomyces sp. JEL0708]|nr:hypothetical protein HDU85_004764 [Gaertneriomyces sp. JEL0708]